MASSSDGTGGTRYDRALLLHGPKRNDVLTLAEVRQYGTDSFGDPDYIKIYGATPPQWYGRGVRLLGRTAVEVHTRRIGHQHQVESWRLPVALAHVVPGTGHQHCCLRCTTLGRGPRRGERARPVQNGPSDHRDHPILRPQVSDAQAAVCSTGV